VNFFGADRFHVPQREHAFRLVAVRSEDHQIVMARILGNLGHQILQRLRGSFEPLEKKPAAMNEQPRDAMDGVVSAGDRYDLSKRLPIRIGIPAATVGNAVQHIGYRGVAGS